MKTAKKLAIIGFEQLGLVENVERENQEWKISKTKM